MGGQKVGKEWRLFHLWWFILMGILLWGKCSLQMSPVFNHSPLACFLLAWEVSFNKSFYFHFKKHTLSSEQKEYGVSHDISEQTHISGSGDFSFSQAVCFLLARHGMVHPNLLIKHMWHCLDRHFPGDTRPQQLDRLDTTAKKSYISCLILNQESQQSQQIDNIRIHTSPVSRALEPV